MLHHALVCADKKLYYAKYYCESMTMKEEVCLYCMEERLPGPCYMIETGGGKKVKVLLYEKLPL